MDQETGQIYLNVMKYIYGDGVAEDHSHAIKLLIETFKELNDMADELN